LEVKTNEGPFDDFRPEREECLIGTKPLCRLVQSNCLNGETMGSTGEARKKGQRLRPIMRKKIKVWEKKKE